MSDQIQQLIPDSKHVISDNQTTRPLNKDEKNIMKIQDRILDKIVIPILKKEYKKNPPLSDKKIKQFLKLCLNLHEISSKRSTMQENAENTLNVYQKGIDKIEKNTIITQKSKNDFIELTNILIDYTEIVNSIINQRFALLEKAIEQIDLHDLFNSLYGSILSFFCIYYLNDMPELQDQNKFQRILDYGKELAKNLDGHIDTLDILTNPDEDERIRKIK